MNKVFIFTRGIARDTRTIGKNYKDLQWRWKLATFPFLCLIVLAYALLMPIATFYDCFMFAVGLVDDAVNKLLKAREESPDCKEPCLPGEAFNTAVEPHNGTQPTTGNDKEIACQ